jgi:hypothetical protein
VAPFFVAEVYRSSYDAVDVGAHFADCTFGRGERTITKNSGTPTRPTPHTIDTMNRKAGAAHHRSATSKARTEKVQKALNANGASVAVTEPRTRRRRPLELFQASHSLKAMGHLDKGTLQKVNLRA